MVCVSGDTGVPRSSLLRSNKIISRWDDAGFDLVLGGMIGAAMGKYERRTLAHRVRHLFVKQDASIFFAQEACGADAHRWRGVTEKTFTKALLCTSLVLQMMSF